MTEHWRDRSVATLAVAAILVGAIVLLGGYILARDWIVVDDALRLGLGIRQLLGRLAAGAFGFRIGHDVGELLVASLAVAIITFGIGVFVGRWSAQR